MTDEPTLFDTGVSTSAPTERETRRRLAKKVFEKQTDAWKQSAYNYAINEWLPYRSAPFLAEDLRTGHEAYAILHGEAPPTTKTSWAGIMAKLVKDARIEVIGYAKRKNGVVATQYKRVK